MRTTWWTWASAFLSQPMGRAAVGVPGARLLGLSNATQVWLY